jgi:TetR/AcrR family transcriptional regulator, tetracycline repressor protein
MNQDDRIARDLARLEESQERAHKRIALQQERIDQRFNHMRRRLNSRYDQPNVAQKRIIDAALELLREDGLNNLSLRKLASRVDMQAPALYWHFKNKEVLVDYMAEAIISKDFKDLQPRQEDEDLQGWLTDKMLKLRQAMLAYPDGARVVAGAHLYPAVSLGNLFERTLESIHSSGVDLTTSRRILMAVTTFTFGFVIEEQASPGLPELEMLKNKELSSRYPYILKASEEAHTNGRNVDDDYKACLQYILKGSVSQAS